MDEEARTSNIRFERDGATVTQGRFSNIPAWSEFRVVVDIAMTDEELVLWETPSWQKTETSAALFNILALFLAFALPGVPFLLLHGDKKLLWRQAGFPGAEASIRDVLELPPAVVACLFQRGRRDKVVEKRDLFASILELADRGALRFQEELSGDITMIQTFRARELMDTFAQQGQPKRQSAQAGSTDDERRGGDSPEVHEHEVALLRVLFPSSSEDRRSVRSLATRATASKTAARHGRGNADLHQQHYLYSRGLVFEVVLDSLLQELVVSDSGYHSLLRFHPKTVRRVAVRTALAFLVCSLLVLVVGASQVELGVWWSIPYLAIGLFGTAVSSLVASRQLPLWTHRGETLTNAVAGLRAELVDSCRHRTPFATASVPVFTDPKEHFSKLLPYATALGLGSEWVSAFAGMSSAANTPVASPATSEVESRLLQARSHASDSNSSLPQSPIATLGGGLPAPRQPLWPTWYVLPFLGSETTPGKVQGTFSRSFEKLKLEIFNALA